MSDLWWLQPGWKQTLCADCGVNIWESGGDPDHGVCHECFNRRWHEHHCEQPEYLCDICGQPGACASVNGFGVCGEGCAHEAGTRTEQAAS